MKRKFYFFVAGILLYFFMGNIAYGQQCGPGAHWIDSCPGGTDTLQSTATVNIAPYPGCSVVATLTLVGPTLVVRGPSDEVDPLDAMCPKPIGHEGANFHIPTEIVNATLTAPAPGPSGEQFILKIGQAANPDLPKSLGHIVEEQDPTLGCSYFHVYFKLYVPAGAFGPYPAMWLHNLTFCTMYTTITQAPPLKGTDYTFPQCVTLYNDLGSPVVNIVDPHHTIIPTLSQWGLIIFALLLLAVGLVYVQRRKVALAIADAESSEGKRTLFDRSLYFKVLAVILLIAAGGLVFIRLYFGFLSKFDMFGTLICSLILSYILHLVIINRENKTK